MAEYKSKVVTAKLSAEAIADKFGDLTAIGSAVDRMSAEDRERLGALTFTQDSIKMDTKQVGVIELKVVERNPQRVTMKAVGMPIDLKLYVDLRSKSPSETDIETVIDVDIPMMLRPMVSGPLQKAVDQIGDMLSRSFES